MTNIMQAYQTACTRRVQQGRLRQLGQRSDKPLYADFSHNDYLGLSKHPQILQAATQALTEWGMGATGSRLLSGDYNLLHTFEAEIANSKGSETALIFISGYQANATALATLLDPQLLGATPLVFSDRLNHASLHHACRLAGVRQQRYRHCDLNHLEALLQKAGVNAPKFIISETVFGMDGDRVDVEALSELAQRYNAFLYLDDAHATGVLGTQGYGLGVATNPNTVVMGTFSKALGGSGAYLACNNTIAQLLVNHCNGFIYSTAPAPATIAAARAAWHLLPTLNNQRQQLLQRAKQLSTRLQAKGFNTGTADTHILPIILGEETLTLQTQRNLLEQGIKVSAVRPPTVPAHTSRLRIALSLPHTHEQIEALMEGLTR